MKRLLCEMRAIFDSCFAEYGPYVCYRKVVFYEWYYRNISRWHTGQYRLSDFTFENLRITAKEDGFAADSIHNVTVKNVVIE